jgi:hypothetical protein
VITLVLLMPPLATSRVQSLQQQCCNTCNGCSKQWPCALSAPFLCMSPLLGPIERVVRTVHVCVLLIEATCACSIHPAQPTFSTEHSSSPQQLHCSFLQRAPLPLPQSVCRCFFIRIHQCLQHLPYATPSVLHIPLVARAHAPRQLECRAAACL